jgi:hypothetical protein
VVAVTGGRVRGRAAIGVLGSVALLASLGAFWHAYGSVRLESDIELGALRVAYKALILFMAASTLVGTALAWDIAWL